MRRATALIVIMMVIILTAYFTKPTLQKCIQEARAQYQQKLENLTLPMPAAINKEVFKETMEKSFEESLGVDDKIVYQSVYLQTGNSKKTIGWGAFGKVRIDIK